jgi:hypothetical protein
MAHGSIATGPSSLYLDLLKGDISPEDYAKEARKKVREDARKPPAKAAAQPQQI